MSRMFKSIDKTWNVFVGCLFECTYCNARKAALTRFKHLDRYKNGFKPHLVESELNRTFQPGQFIMVTYMGDIAFTSINQRHLITNHTQNFPQTNFLFCTKDPWIFEGDIFSNASNFYLGTTIETNRHYSVTYAPAPFERYIKIQSGHFRIRFLSIEPIMDFDLKTLTRWIGHIQPDIIEVGADNYHNHLPEPSPEKLEQLLANLRQICPTVIEKHGLQRLKERS